MWPRMEDGGPEIPSVFMPPASPVLASSSRLWAYTCLWLFPCLTLRPPPLRSGSNPSCSPLTLNSRRATSPLTVHGTNNMTKGPTSELRKPTNTSTLAVGEVFHLSSLSLTTESSSKLGALKQCWQLAPGPMNLSLSSAIPPPVLSRVTLTRMAG